MKHKSWSGEALCLRLHADYLCQHAGACCTAGWAIPIEKRAYQQVRVHFGGQEPRRLFADGGPLPESAAAVLSVQPSGACVFFEPDRGNLCAVHRELGVPSLPSACRHFPRIVLHDARGTFISLSHFCPTAAGLLRSPSAASFEVVRASGPLALESVISDITDDCPSGLEGSTPRACPSTAPSSRTAHRHRRLRCVGGSRALELSSNGTISTVEAALGSMASATARHSAVDAWLRVRFAIVRPWSRAFWIASSAHGCRGSGSSAEDMRRQRRKTGGELLHQALRPQMTSRRGFRGGAGALVSPPRLVERLAAPGQAISGCEAVRHLDRVLQLRDSMRSSRYLRVSLCRS